MDPKIIEILNKNGMELPMYMKEKIVYLDWNAVKKMKSLTFSNDNKNIVIPFSEVHLSDLEASLKPEYFDKVNSDLMYLSMVSSRKAFFNVEITCEEDGKTQNYIGIKRESDVFAALREVNEGSGANEKDRKMLVPNVEVRYPQNTKLFKEGSELQEIFEKNNYTLNFDFYVAMFSLFYEDGRIFKDKEIYDSFRSFFKDKETFIDNMKLRKIIDYANEVDERKVETLFLDTVDYYYSLNPSMNIDVWIARCLYLEFSPCFRDKLKGKNKYSNIIKDAKHLQYAFISDYFVTNDNKMHKKASFLVKAYNLKTKVLKVEEFINLYSSIES